MKSPAVAVSSQSFSKDERLRQRASERFPHIEFKYCDPTVEWSEEKLVSFLTGADIWIVGKEPVTLSILERLPTLKLISKYGVGLDNIKFEDCSLANVSVYFEAGVNSEAVAEQTIGMMIGLTRNLFKSSRYLADGVWLKNGGLNFSGSTVSIVGCGHVGSKVANLAKAFNCNVLVNDIKDKSGVCQSIGARQVSWNEALRKADILSFHVPFTEQTNLMFGDSAIAQLKRGALVVNTSKGQVIDQEALKRALICGRIGGSALDVYAAEPLVDKSLYSLDNFVGTAHIAGNSRQAVWGMGIAALNGVEKFLLDR